MSTTTEENDEEILEEPSRAFTQALVEQVNREDVQSMVQLQREMLSRYEKTNEMLINFNILSSARCEATTQEFRQHTQVLGQMKADLDIVFRRIRSLKQRLGALYPDAFAACSDVYNILEQSEDEEEKQVVAPEIRVTGENVVDTGCNNLTGENVSDSGCNNLMGENVADSGCNNLTSAVQNSNSVSERGSSSKQKPHKQFLEEETSKEATLNTSIKPDVSLTGNKVTLITAADSNKPEVSQSRDDLNKIETVVNDSSELSEQCEGKVNKADVLKEDKETNAHSLNNPTEQSSSEQSIENKNTEIINKSIG